MEISIADILEKLHVCQRIHRNIKYALMIILIVECITVILALYAK